jgi:uncharacterized protein YcbK (DUF882 family)
MVNGYKKGISAKLSAHFSTTEFDCHCSRPSCDITYVDDDLIKFLEEKRDMVGKQFNVLSGFRCTAHNHEVGGKPGSQHLQGKAADLQFPLNDILDYVDFFKDADGLGIYRKKHFLHVDVRGHRARWEG